MSALPGQSVDNWMESLKKVVGLEPEHISAYSLIVEEGTPFYDWYHELDGAAEADEKNGTAGRMPPLPSEEEDRLMYEKTGEYLCEKGYGRYEISNYALDSRECKHNLGYWNRDNYIGIGVGAASLVDSFRFNNIRDTDEYIELVNSYSGGSLLDQPWIDKDTIEELSENDKMSEFMYLGLREVDGVSSDIFEKTFNKSIDDVFGDVLKKYIDLELIKTTDMGYALTDKGIDISNYVLSDFILE